MLKRELNGSIVINICDQWSDLTLHQGVELYKIGNRFPDAVKKMYELSIGEQNDEVTQKMTEYENSLTDEQKIKHLPTLYGELMALLTDIDSSIINQLMPDQRTLFYQQYLSRFVIGILNFPIDLNIKQIASFEFKGETYYLPTTQKFKIGNVPIERPMNNVTAIEFTEAADLQLAEKQLEGGRIETLSNIIAILCRPKGEPYNEAVSLQRAELFMQELTMDIAWEVFFCLVELFSSLKKRSQISLMVQELTKGTTLNYGNMVGMFKLKPSLKVRRK